jgi:Flp pilus assembly pilin Flp
MTEYVILVGLLAILLVTAVATFKNKIEETFNKSTNSIDSNITQKITQASAT